MKKASAATALLAVSAALAGVKDFVLFYCEKDEEEAKQLKERVEKEGHGISGYLYNHVNTTSADYDAIETICQRGVQMWFYITDNFIADLEMQFLKDEFLVKSIIHGNKTFVPIWAKPKNEFKDLPFGLVAFYGLDASDGRLVERIRTMFSRPEHARAKELLEKEFGDAKDTE